MKAGIILRRWLPCTIFCLLLVTVPRPEYGAAAASPAGQSIRCDADNGGIELPEGFCALVVADDIGPARHLAVTAEGDIYVALRQVRHGGGIAALRDTDGDGRADLVRYFGERGGNGIGLHGGYLYFAPDTAVWRYRLTAGKLVPDGAPETVVEDFLEPGEHAAKTIAFGGDILYVDVGSQSNACQEKPRTPGSPGIDPCPQLERHAGIWRFPADLLHQRQVDGIRFASGIRNAVAMAWNPLVKRLYAVQHGRDQLHQLWPDLYNEEQGAELPDEEFLLVAQGDDFGWPYCYYDSFRKKKVLAPEYGGDGEKIGRCAKYQDPILAFPAHWAPNDLLFYTGGQFPQRWHGGAFIAFHGSWNRAPLPQQGYKVVFVPFDGETPAGKWEDFATGFAGRAEVFSPSQARYRPMGLAQGPDGSLYIADSKKGKIWRVTYRGKQP